MSGTNYVSAAYAAAIIGSEPPDTPPTAPPAAHTSREPEQGGGSYSSPEGLHPFSSYVSLSTGAAMILGSEPPLTTPPYVTPAEIVGSFPPESSPVRPPSAPPLSPSQPSRPTVHSSPPSQSQSQSPSPSRSQAQPPTSTPPSSLSVPRVDIADYYRSRHFSVYCLKCKEVKEAKVRPCCKEHRHDNVQYMSAPENWADLMGRSDATCTCFTCLTTGVTTKVAFLFGCRVCNSNEVVFSQSLFIDWTGTTHKCEACRNDFRQDAMVWFPCGHCLCTGCFISYTTLICTSPQPIHWNQTDKQHAIKCCYSDCPTSFLPDDRILKILGPELYNRYKAKCANMFSLMDRGDTSVYCSNPQCMCSGSPFIIVHRGNSGSSHYGECPMCKTITCLVCKDNKESCSCPPLLAPPVPTTSLSTTGHFCRGIILPPEKERNLILSIKGNTTLIIQIHRDFTIKMVKKVIEETSGDRDLYPCFRQKLLAGGKQLEDTETIGRYNLENESTVFLIMSTLSPETGSPSSRNSSASESVRSSVRSFVGTVCQTCPKCGAGITKPRSHGCHTVKCPQCGQAFCYNCRAIGKCECLPYCTDKCICLPCTECRRNKRCPGCGGCDVCKL
ncbi:hypothetical protein Pelo_5644 [Pelomyxa schiedti]|nr:hypothetical protein Pelo_5644 [Pelomyxa schiedti]